MIYTKTYNAPMIDYKEILRFSGVRGDAPELEQMLQNCIDELKGKLVYKICYREFPVIYQGGRLNLGFAETKSEALKKNLSGCDKLILFAATVGIELDRLISRYGAVSASKAFLFQAIGAERIESLCDVFNREIAEQNAAKGFAVRPRFSPGYGDFPLEMQKEIFSVLDCPRKIGLSLNESLLMSPSKSVTAIVGIASKKCAAEEASGCRNCAKQDCAYRSIEKTK